MAVPCPGRWRRVVGPVYRVIRPCGWADFCVGTLSAGQFLARHGRQGLTTLRGLFGLRFARHVDAGEITAIERSIGMQASQGSQSRAYYRIEVLTRDGRRITAGAGIPGVSSVDAIIRRLEQALDLPGALERGRR